MPYYRGDYYRGDYYRGDVSSFVRGAAKRLTGAFLPAPISAALGMFGRGQSQPQGPGVKIGPISIHPRDVFPGGKPFLTGAPGTPFAAQAQTGMAGYHLDKATHSRLVRNRRMNPSNPRALRRAIRREHSFVALARHVLKGTGITIGRHRFGAAKKAKR